MDNFLKLDENYVQIYNSVHELYSAGYSKRKIAKLLKMSRNTISKYIHGKFEVLCQKKIKSRMDVYHDHIVKSLQAGMNRKDVYNTVVAKGFSGKQSAAYDYMNKIVDYYDIDISIGKSSSAESIQKKKDLQNYDYLTRAEIFKSLWMNSEISQEHEEYMFSEYPQLCELDTCIKEFREIFTEKRLQFLYLFIERYKASEIKALSVFATGLEKDIEAVENAVVSDLSNGFVEGTISKLKMVKRVMYGRCGNGLLTAKMMYNASG